MKTATYTNRATGETYQLSGVKNIGQAWNLSEFVARRMNWNHEMFAQDVKVTISK